MCSRNYYTIYIIVGIIAKYVVVTVEEITKCVEVSKLLPKEV